MSRPGAKDYPLAETRPEAVRGRRGLTLDEITLERVLAGEVTMEDLRITPGALRDQAAIARDAGRETLAQNFERAAELVDVPQDVIMETYEMLRPGRVRDKAELLARAALFRDRYNAPRIAAFIEEAAEIYERRGLFTFRF
jgi:propanediol dehydratase small subunit